MHFSSCHPSLAYVLLRFIKSDHELNTASLVYRLMRTGERERKEEEEDKGTEEKEEDRQSPSEVDNCLWLHKVSLWSMECSVLPPSYLALSLFYLSLPSLISPFLSLARPPLSYLPKERDFSCHLSWPLV